MSRNQKHIDTCLYFLASKNLILINNYPCIFKEKLYDFEITSGGLRVLTVFCFSSMYPRFLRLLRDPQGLYYQSLRLNVGEGHTRMCGVALQRVHRHGTAQA